MLARPVPETYCETMMMKQASNLPMSHRSHLDEFFISIQSLLNLLQPDKWLDWVSSKSTRN